MTDEINYWRLCDELTVVQAALLLVGKIPSSTLEHRVEKTADQPPGYEATRNAIFRALLSGRIAGKTASNEYDGIEPRFSYVETESLRSWLSARGVRDGFFFPEPLVSQDYLDPSHPRYAPKLAAAVRAWLAAGDELATKGRSPKQALTKWLREHAVEFELVDEEGKPNETGIEEAAKVANWQPSGGAPKT
jgi:hypothetical protein